MPVWRSVGSVSAVSGDVREQLSSSAKLYVVRVDSCEEQSKDQEMEPQAQPHFEFHLPPGSPLASSASDPIIVSQR